MLPTWFLVPFAIVAVLGLVGGAVLDIYSSGLSLLTLGAAHPALVAALIDGVILVLGTIYVVFVAEHFLVPFQGFLITLGVPIAAWPGSCWPTSCCAARLRRGRAVRRRGRYGDVRWPRRAGGRRPVLGWGLVTNSDAASLTWQGYLLGPARARRQRGAGRTPTWVCCRAGPRVRRDPLLLLSGSRSPGAHEA